MWTALLIGTVFAFLGFRLGKAKAYRELGPAVREAYELGIENGKKEVTEGAYRTPAALPPAPPRSRFDEGMERFARMAQVLASSGMWMDEGNRAEWERRNKR